MSLPEERETQKNKSIGHADNINDLKFRTCILSRSWGNLWADTCSVCTTTP